ncbi:MAG: bifunctional nuclease family protein [Gemmatimonadetes bacterium]|nr:bifunctional nuclease family protein [Gemmatimonadota bacterium]
MRVFPDPDFPAAERNSTVLAEVKVYSLGLDRTNRMPVVILRERGGARVLPIWIGPSEAKAIATQLAKVPHTRPLTHDLTCSLLTGMGGTLLRVVVSRVEESTYFAELVVEKAGELVSIDARPSDSIALALRAGASILVEEGLLQAMAIELPTPGEGDLDDPAQGSVMQAKELKDHLRSLDPQDFGRFKL